MIDGIGENGQDVGADDDSVNFDYPIGISHHWERFLSLVGLLQEIDFSGHTHGGLNLLLSRFYVHQCIFLGF